MGSSISPLHHLPFSLPSHHTLSPFPPPHTQERYFGTFFQRILSEPLGVRFHYGHPDLLDKIHFLTRGGVSSASKQINLSEDVFAGYKTVHQERGGAHTHKHY